MFNKSYLFTKKWQRLEDNASGIAKEIADKYVEKNMEEDLSYNEICKLRIKAYQYVNDVLFEIDVNDID